ncbi:MAG: hypothetical protein KAG97_08325 [Victivallales bacterium]|nr:hypothetical protein [Victivallales bacterium]
MSKNSLGKILDRIPNHYELLGLPLFESDVKKIREAALESIQELKKWEIHRDRDIGGKINELVRMVSRAFAEISDERRKKVYDVLLKEELGLSDSESSNIEQISDELEGDFGNTPAPNGKTRGNRVPGRYPIVRMRPSSDVDDTAKVRVNSVSEKVSSALSSDRRVKQLGQILGAFHPIKPDEAPLEESSRDSGAARNRSGGWWKSYKDTVLFSAIAPFPLLLSMGMLEFLMALRSRCGYGPIVLFYAVVCLLLCAATIIFCAMALATEDESVSIGRFIVFLIVLHGSTFSVVALLNMFI